MPAKAGRPGPGRNFIFVGPARPGPARAGRARGGPARNSASMIYRAALVTPSSLGAKNTPRNENLDQSDFPNPRFEKKSEKNTQKMTIFGDLLFYRFQSSNSMFLDGVLTTI